MTRQLLFLSDVRYGGWVTFTYHLAMILGKPMVLRPANSFRGGGVFYDALSYKNVAASALRQLPKPIVTAVSPNKRHILKDLQSGYLVVHDPTEFCEELFEYAKRSKTFVIRHKVQKALAAKGIESTLLRHPFYQYAKAPAGKRVNRAMSRVDWDKHTDLILRANALGADVNIHGQVNNQYFFHGKLEELDFKRWHRGAYGRTLKESSQLYGTTRHLVDMSVIKGDGGGTQYTFLDAEYHGAGLILNRGWTEVEGSLYQDGVNCYAVSTPEELCDALQRPPLVAQLLPTQEMNQYWKKAMQ